MKELKKFIITVLILCGLFGGVLLAWHIVIELLVRFMSR